MRDQPELSAMDCLRESKRIMTGNKAKLFTLMLSFIGWGLLALLPGAIYSGTFVGINEIPSLFDSLMMFVLGAGYLWVGAYYYTSLVVFYELLKGNISGQVFVPEQY